jgi:hypothetical protein
VLEEFTMAEKIKDSAGEAMRHNGTSSKMAGGRKDDEQIQIEFQLFC